MESVQSLAHAKWEYKYHVVWIPKRRKKTLYGELRRYLGETFRDLAVQKECNVIEGHLLPDHVHMLIVTNAIQHSITSVDGDRRQKSG